MSVDVVAEERKYWELSRQLDDIRNEMNGLLKFIVSSEHERLKLINWALVGISVVIRRIALKGRKRTYTQLCFKFARGIKPRCLMVKEEHIAIWKKFRNLARAYKAIEKQSLIALRKAIPLGASVGRCKKLEFKMGVLRGNLLKIWRSGKSGSGIVFMSASNLPEDEDINKDLSASAELELLDNEIAYLQALLGNYKDKHLKFSGKIEGEVLDTRYVKWFVELEKLLVMLVEQRRRIGGGAEISDELIKRYTELEKLAGMLRETDSDAKTGEA